MFSIRVERHINKTPEDIFAVLEDHANYQKFRAIDKSNLLEAGTDEQNGLGALREIIAGKSVLHERIVEFKRPYCLAYIIEYSKPLPYEHELGSITLKETEDGTLVVWESKGHINIPLLGTWYFDKQIEKMGSRAFGSILKAIDMQ
jgi:uncharacterized protein YndB with AHSA1/START domain